jgi:hypothetical protein
MRFPWKRFAALATLTALVVQGPGQPTLHLVPGLGDEMKVKEEPSVSFRVIEDAQGNVTGAYMITPAGVVTLPKK